MPSLSQAERNRFAAIVARTGNASAALKAVIGEPAARELSPEAIRSRASRLARGLVAEIATARAQLASAAEGGAQPLDAVELHEFASLVTSSISSAIEAAELHRMPLSVVASLRRALTVHAGRLGRMAPLAPSAVQAGDDTDMMLNVISALRPCACQATAS